MKIGHEHQAPKTQKSSHKRGTAFGSIPKTSKGASKRK